MITQTNAIKYAIKFYSMESTRFMPYQTYNNIKMKQGFTPVNLSHSEKKILCSDVIQIDQQRIDSTTNTGTSLLVGNLAMRELQQGKACEKVLKNRKNVPLINPFQQICQPHNSTQITWGINIDKKIATYSFPSYVSIPLCYIKYTHLSSRTYITITNFPKSFLYDCFIFF